MIGGSGVVSGGRNIRVRYVAKHSLGLGRNISPSLYLIGTTMETARPIAMFFEMLAVVSLIEPVVPHEAFALSAAGVAGISYCVVDWAILAIEKRRSKRQVSR